MQSRHAVIVLATLTVVGAFVCSPKPASAQPRTIEERGMPRDATRQVMGRLSSADRSFLLSAIEAGQLDVELGKLAVERGGIPRVRELGQRIVEDQGKANQELADLAQAKGLSAPAAGHDSRLVRRLGELSGAAFDRAYVDEMLRDHQADVKKLWRESQEGDDSAVRSWSAEQLPVRQAQYGLVLELDKQVRAAARSTAGR